MGLTDHRSSKGRVVRFPLFFFLFFICIFPSFTQQNSVSLASEISRLERLASGGSSGRQNAFLELIRLYRLSGNSEAALKTAESALAAFPGDGRFILEQGRLLISIGEYDRATLLFADLRNSGDAELAKQGRLLSAKLEAFRSLPQALAALADDPDFTEYRSDIYFTLWKLTSLALWKDKLAAEFPRSPEAKMVSGAVNLNPSPLWLLFPGRESLGPAQTNNAVTLPTVTVTPSAAPLTVSPSPLSAESALPVGSAETGERYLQTGVFGREENAKAMAERLQKAGFHPQIRARAVNGNDLWAVLVSGGSDISAAIKKLKEAGFDSFPAAN